MGFKKRDKAGNGLKTQPNTQSVTSFIAAIVDDRRRGECETVLAMLGEITGQPAVMWGASIIGFGSYHYKYASGREGDWLRAGFSPRKASLTIYCMAGFKQQVDLLERLGPNKTSVSCLYLRRLADTDLDVLCQLLTRAVAQMAQMYPEH